jgi:hypothetical protein
MTQDEDKQNTKAQHNTENDNDEQTKAGDEPR